ncbi:S1C family serine protease [Chloroflexota bacterium]
MKKLGLKSLLLCLVLLLSLVLSSGCGIIPEEWLMPPSDVEETLPSTSASTTSTPIDPNQASPPPCNGGEPLPDFVAVVEKVKPSVVAIQTDTGYGSGWIIRQDGIIVTNNHVVTGAQTIAVTLDDGKTFAAEEVRTDPLTDLAVVTIGAEDLTAAEIGNCEILKVGQPVAAIGNALGLGIRMTGGWISRLEVSIPVSAGQTLDDLIETDAAINPGNSGGPLVNMAGEVIGITSVKVSQVGIEGLGYAISMTTAKDVIDQLILKGYVTRTYLGVGLSDVTPMVAFFNDLALEQGAFVTRVVEDSPAYEAGLEEGDVIVKMDDEAVTGSGELLKAIHSRSIGQTVEIVYWRGDTMGTTEATLIESPPPTS